ncbi:unnamed protein product [Caenorhabditis brenneri]
MLDTKIKVLGLLIVTGAILLLVGAFTPCWSAGYYNYYYSSSYCTDVFWGNNYWIALAGWLVLISIVLYIIMCYAYYKAVQKNDFGSSDIQASS